MNYVAAKSEADGMLEQRNQNLQKMAQIVTSSMISRANSAKNKEAVKKELLQLMSGFSTEEKLEIMINVFLRMC